MLIKITIYDVIHNGKIDIQVDNNQRIKTTLKVLSENIEEFKSFHDIKVIRIKDSGRRINVDSTYEKAGIYTGAGLIVCKEADLK